MENVLNMQMANSLLKQNCVEIEKSCFGLFKKVFYTPTHSLVIGLTLEFSVDNGLKVQHLLDSPPKELNKILQKEGCPEVAENGGVQLSLCFSKDHRFAAMQLSKYMNFEYHPIGEIHFMEGADAERMLRLFVT